MAANDPKDQGPRIRIERSATTEDLFTLAQRILGSSRAHALFTRIAKSQGRERGLPVANEELIAEVERALSGAVGAASAHAMVSQVTVGGNVSFEELIRIADETAQIMEYSQRLEEQSRTLSETAEKLRQANTRLRRMSEQKDAFLSQVSHELRTPMTSIRAFADILREMDETSSDDAHRFATIISTESERLTRLLDEILDLSVLESGQANWKLRAVRLGDALDQAVAGTVGIRTDEVRLVITPGGLDQDVMADPDRLAQVIINLISNGGEIRSGQRSGDPGERRHRGRQRLAGCRRQRAGDLCAGRRAGLREVLEAGCSGSGRLGGPRSADQPRDHAQFGRESGTDAERVRRPVPPDIAQGRTGGGGGRGGGRGAARKIRSPFGLNFAAAAWDFGFH